MSKIWNSTSKPQSYGLKFMMKTAQVLQLAAVTNQNVVI